MPWQSLYHRLFDTMRQGVVYQDAAGMIVSMNPAAERILGRSRPEFLGQSSVSVEHNTLREDGSPFPGLEHPAMVALRTGRQVRDVVMQVYNPREQQYRWISITAMPLFQEGESNPYQVYTIFDDITERRAAEASLRETQQLTAALNRINETIHASLNIDEIMQRLVSEGATALGCDTAAVSLRQADRWTIRHVHGFPASLVGMQSQDDEERHAMLALHTRQPVAIADAYNDDRVDSGHMRWHKIRAVLVAPLIVRDEPFGALFFNYHHGPHPFGQAQVQFAAQLAATAAIALENGRLFDERLKSEQELRQNREWLRVTLTSIGDGVIATDVQGRVTFLNPVAAALTGWQQDEAWGRPIGDVFNIINEQTHQPAEAIVERVLREGHVLVLANHTALMTKDGREVPIEDSAAPILDAEGYVSGVVLVFHDVTDKRRAQRALQESEKRFRTLAEVLPEIVWVTDAEGKATYVNPTYRQYAGTDLETDEARAALIHPDDQPRVSERYDEAVRSGSMFECEYRMRRHDGQYRWFLGRAVQVGDDQGRPGGRIGAATDIHDLKQVEEVLEQRVRSRTAELQASQAALLQAERLTTVGKLAASVAHEINNPLQAVVGCLGLAIGAMEKGQDPGRYVRIANDEVLRTARIVTQLRSLGRPTGEGHREPTDLNRLLSDVLLLNKKHLDNQGIEVTWEPDAGLPEIDGVPDALRQVFLNLVLNAAEAMPGGGQLRLSTACTTLPDGVQVRVADSGSGIPPDVLPHIFDAFYSTKDEGMGIGLFLSQSIVQQHGGHIEVESAPGAGTTFSVWLPAPEAAPAV